MAKKSSNDKPIKLSKIRNIFTAIVVLNIIALLERSAFDFLGFMFNMIIADIFYLLFLIIGLFGVYQFRINYVVSLTVTSLIWIIWQIFIICVYLNIGSLNRYDPIYLNLNTGKTSWWLTSSFACKTEISNELEKIQIQEQLNAFNFVNPTTLITTIGQTNMARMFDNLVLFNQDPRYKHLNKLVQTNCLIPFYFIEIIHSGVLIFFAILVIIFGLLVSNALNEETDSFDYIGGFDTAQIKTQNNFNIENQPTLPRNGHIRLEPLYAVN